MRPPAPVQWGGARGRVTVECRDIRLSSRIVFSARPTFYPVSRETVPTPTPCSRAIARMLLPAARAARIVRTLAASSAMVAGRPSRVPSAFARANPAMTRSRIIERSNSAKTPIIWNIARPDGVVVSIPCWCRYKSTCLACSSCSSRQDQSAIGPTDRRSRLQPCRSLSERRPEASCSSPGRSSRPLAPLMP